MRAIFNGKTIAENENTVIVENSHYFPPRSVNMDYLKNRQERAYTCHWKGVADYYDVVVDGQTAEGAAWIYPEPTKEAQNIAGYYAFWKGVEVTE